MMRIYSSIMVLILLGILVSGCAKLRQRQANSDGENQVIMPSLSEMLPDDAVPADVDGNLASLQAIIKSDPGNSEAYNQLAVALAEKGKYQQASDHFKKAIELDPNYYQAYSNIGLLYQRIGHDDKAMQYYEHALKINPNYAKAYIGRGDIYFKLKTYDLALKDYNKALALDPRNARVFYNQGLVHQARDDHQKAIRSLSRSVVIDSSRPYAFVARGRSYMIKRDYEKALVDFTHVLNNHQNDAQIWILRGQALEKTGRYILAKDAYIKALESEPENEIAIASLERANRIHHQVQLGQGSQQDPAISGNLLRR